MRYPCTSVAAGNAGVARLGDGVWGRERERVRERATYRQWEREREGEGSLLGRSPGQAYGEMGWVGARRVVHEAGEGVSG